MTRSNIPTDYILLPAYTNSELESCKFVIVHVPPSYKAELIARLALLQPLKIDQNLSGLSFWDGSAAYYIGYGEGNEPILDDNDEWVYVNLTEQELAELPVPENRLDTFELKLTPDWSTVYYAEKWKTILVSGDRTLRQLAEIKHVEVHGVFWLLDLLAGKSILTKAESRRFLLSLSSINKRLPANEIKERLRRWL